MAAVWRKGIPPGDCERSSAFKAKVIGQFCWMVVEDERMTKRQVHWGQSGSINSTSYGVYNGIAAGRKEIECNL